VEVFLENFCPQWLQTRISSILLPRKGFEIIEDKLTLFLPIRTGKLRGSGLKKPKYFGSEPKFFYRLGAGYLKARNGFLLTWQTESSQNTALITHDATLLLNFNNNSSITDEADLPY
jgi:hypothetical protein